MSTSWKDEHGRFAEQRIFELFLSIHEETKEENFLEIFKKCLRLIEANQSHSLLDAVSRVVHVLAQDTRVTEEFLVKEFIIPLRYRISALTEGIRDNGMLPLWLLSERHDFFKVLSNLQRLELQHLLAISIARRFDKIQAGKSLEMAYSILSHEEKKGWIQDTLPIVKNACSFEGVTVFGFDNPMQWSAVPNKIEENHWCARFPPPWYVEKSLKRLADALQIEEDLYILVLSKV